MLAKILCFLNIGPWLKKNFTVLVVILLVCCGSIVLPVWLAPPFPSSLTASQRSKFSTVIIITNQPGNQHACGLFLYNPADTHDEHVYLNSSVLS